MTFPKVETTSIDSVAASNSPVMTLPAGIQSGDLLIALIGGAGFGSINIPAGWTQILTNASVSISFARFSIFARVADGLEGATLAFTTGQVFDTLFIGYRISGVDGLPEANSFAQANQNPSPPNLSPSGGAKDYLWLTGYYKRNTPAGTPPSGYSSKVSNQAFGDSVEAAQRDLNAASEDPGLWTIPSGFDDGVAVTIAITPVVPQVRKLHAGRLGHFWFGR